MTQLVTFGETMLRLSPPTGERLSTTRRLDVRAGGAESNVAVASASLGVEAAWLSKLPDSPLGRRVLDELRGHGVTPHVAWDDGPDARLGTYYLEPGGTPRGTDVIYDRAGASITTVRPTELATQPVTDADYCYTSGITPALSGAARETTADLLERARAAGTTTVFDLNYRAKLWEPATARASYRELFPSIDVLVAPRRDVETVLDRDPDAGEGATAAARLARGLVADHDFRTVILTRGDEGAVAVHDGGVIEQPTYEAETLDPIGTGDAFVGGYLAKRIQGGDVSTALSWAAATAALKRTIAGDLAVVTPEEVASVVTADDTTIDR